MNKEFIAGLDREKIGDLILVNSPLRDYGNRPKDNYEVLPPLGLGYIATQADYNGYNVGVIDAEHHGIKQSELVSIVNNLNPRYVGINVFTPNRIQSLLFAEKLNSDISLIIGGPHATTMSEKTLCDFSLVHEKVILIRGEAELAVSQVLSGQSVCTIPGVFWFEKGEIKSTPGLSTPECLDELPLLDRKFLANDPSIDSHTGKVESRVLTSRGCPYNCTICAGARKVLNLLTRNRCAESVAQEICGLVLDNNVQSIRFVDDLFISNEEKTRSILDTVKKLNISNIYWDATGRANILAKFSSKFYDYLKESGANEIALGIESGSERLREKINKQVSLEDIYRSVDGLIKRDIMVKGYFVIGIPTETKLETLSTIDLARQLTLKSKGKFRASIFVFRPYPETEEWKKLVKKGFDEKDLLLMSTEGEGERAKHKVLTTLQFGECSPEELSKLLSQYEDWQNNYFS